MHSVHRTAANFQMLFHFTGERWLVFQNKVQKGICAPKGEEVRRDSRKLHNGELSNLYPSPIIVTTSDQLKEGEMSWTRSTHRSYLKCKV